MAKKEKTTIGSLKKCKIAKYSLFGGMFVCPLIPTSISLGLHAEEWFGKAGASLPLGLVTLILAVTSAIVGILNSGTIFKKGTITLYILAFGFMIVGIVNLFLASLFQSCGYLWLEIGASLLGTAGCYTVEQKVVEPKIERYQELIKKYHLDKKGQKELEDEERAKKEADRLAKEKEIREAQERAAD